MTPHENIESHIDETLDRLGSAQPRAGLEERVQQHLLSQGSRFSLSIVHYVAGGALAAGVALSAAMLNPTVRSAVFPSHSPSVSAPHVSIPAGGGFGAAGVVHVPEQPVAVQPTPENQGRGRARSGRAVLPKGAVTPLPRGVVTPHVPAGVPAAQ
jgi:hypothetical protein